MPLDHQAALQWAQANPKDPRAQDIMAKAWAAQNPDDPRSEQVMAHVNSKYAAPPQNAAEQPGANPYAISTTQDAQQKQQDQSSEAMQFVKKAIGAGAGMIAGVAKGATLDNVDVPHLLGFDKDPNTTTGFNIGDLVGKTGVGALVGSFLPEAGGALGRIASGATAGGVIGGAEAPQDGSTRAQNALQGAAVGGALGTGLEGLQSLLKGTGRAITTGKQAMQLSSGSPELQDQARSAVNDTTNALNNKLLATKVHVNPTDYLGHTPEVDQLMRNEIAKQSPNGTIPSTIQLSGSTLNNIKQHLSQELPWEDASFNPLNTLSSGTVQKANQIQSAVDKANSALKSISPNIDQITQQADQSAGMAKNPLSALTSLNPDTMANISRLSDSSGSDLADLADQIRAAKKVSKGPISGSLAISKQGLKGAKNSLTSSAEPGSLNSQSTLGALLGALSK